MNKINPHRKI